ncbi:MAG: hypothetical protein JO212_16615, partial [Acetobacteraceae bacterium]|nr:hypothetical protein [Acetobacteraceae bacterium]
HRGLHRFPAARHHHSRNRAIGQVIALVQHLLLALHHLRLLRLIIAFTASNGSGKGR